MVSSDKHLLNDPTSLVIESLQGLSALNPNLHLDAKHKGTSFSPRGITAGIETRLPHAVVYRSPTSQVSLVSGGGSGHEPAHPGFVGEGMLTAAVAGNVFASPNASQVARAIELVDGEKGTLIVVKNYTGDILNFGLAKEQYAASHPEKADRVKFLVVGEDVSVGRTQGGIVGRRGLAGTVLVYKIAGALAAKGADIDAVYSVAEYVSSRIGTIGVGLDHCHVPGTATPESHLSSSEIEIGMGIHNEPGHAHVSPIPPLRELVASLLDLLTSTTDPERSFLPFGTAELGKDEVVLMVNNLGGLSELEMGGIARESSQQLHGRGIKVQRLLVGSFMTSLNMPGFSLTLLLLPRSGEPALYASSELLALLDDQPNAPGWKWSSHAPPTSDHFSLTRPIPPTSSVSSSQGSKIISAAPDFNARITRAMEALIGAEPEITRLDRIVGDGDCGLTLKAGAEAVLRGVHEGAVRGTDVIGAMAALARIVADNMDGTGGALYSIFFAALAQGVHDCTTAAAELSSQDWTSALQSAYTKLLTYTRARPPSRTLIDPLAAFIDSLEQGNRFQVAATKATEAAEATKHLPAVAGRAAYVEKEKVYGVMDPGAKGVSVILNALAGQ